MQFGSIEADEKTCGLTGFIRTNPEGECYCTLTSRYCR